ncbi:hypothetical protein QWZ03_20095 [Chitinimonas viridis]|uniref:Uncharacterized protein n=1 Tax=Chitinimonas viridis TaxID=664880 RepID=A0ABT8BAL5_9NEIS|nr:hypothetical protein [Chitinimonas viridis]MDN3579075.1 hypothetical protein [Chitinimonas viridis]
MQFDPVEAAHFSMLSRNPFPHMLIDQALLQVAGGDVQGSQFRKDALAAAGWRHSSLVPFGKYPDEAASAFNRLREALAVTEEPAAILAKLKQS